LGAIGFIWSRNEYRVITSELEGLMRERATLIANIIRHEFAEHDEISLEQHELQEANINRDMLVAYIDRSGVVHDLTPDQVEPQQAEVFLELRDTVLPHTNPSDHSVTSEIEAGNIYAVAPVFDPQNRRVGDVCVLMPLGQLDAYISRMRWLLIGAISVVVLLGLAVSGWLTDYFSRQFSRAKGLAATVSEGNYHLRIPEAGPTELRDLSHYLNVMAEKLQEQVKTRRMLLANVTHELARPLAGLQLGIESLRKGAVQDPHLADDLLVSMEHSINRMKSRVEDLALAAQPESRPIELQLTEVAIEPFLKGIATFFWTMATSHDIKLQVEVKADLPLIWVDEKRLHQILANLVDNAIKFTPPGKTIKLSAERAGECHICLMVHDGGPGLLPGEAEHLFRPFYQGESGLRLKQGMGLGLSIAQQLTQAHNGTLTLENHPAGGVLATLMLPIAPT
jgi:signal transduction histidine kinase